MPKLISMPLGILGVGVYQKGPSGRKRSNLRWLSAPRRYDSPTQYVASIKTPLESVRIVVHVYRRGPSCQRCFPAHSRYVNPPPPFYLNQLTTEIYHHIPGTNSWYPKSSLFLWPIHRYVLTVNRGCFWFQSQFQAIVLDTRLQQGTTKSLVNFTYKLQWYGTGRFYLWPLSIYRPMNITFWMATPQKQGTMPQQGWHDKDPSLLKSCKDKASINVQTNRWFFSS